MIVRFLLFWVTLTSLILLYREFTVASVKNDMKYWLKRVAIAGVISVVLITLLMFVNNIQGV